MTTTATFSRCPFSNLLSLISIPNCDSNLTFTYYLLLLSFFLLLLFSLLFAHCRKYNKFSTPPTSPIQPRGPPFIYPYLCQTQLPFVVLTLQLISTSLEGKKGRLMHRKTTAVATTARLFWKQSCDDCRQITCCRCRIGKFDISAVVADFFSIRWQKGHRKNIEVARLPRIARPVLSICPVRLQSFPQFRLPFKVEAIGFNNY